jgi:ABC-type dipeptide/oligopeptide/nickel transport system permease subunit
MKEEVLNPKAMADDEPLLPHETPWEEFVRIFTKDRMAIAGCIVLLFLLVAAMGGKVMTEWVVVFDAEVVRLPDKFLPPLSIPSEEVVRPQDQPIFGLYLFGTDELGRDVFARMLQGSFVSLSIGFIAVGISVFIGILLGGLSGFYGNVKLGFITVDTLIMRFTDVMLCFPTFFLILTVVALLPPSIYNIMIVIGLTSWMGTARFVRAEFLSLREQDYVAAAQALGLPAGTTDYFPAYGPQCHCTSAGICHHWSCNGNPHGIGVEFFGLWGTTPLCDMGEYSRGWQGVYLRCALAIFYPWNRDLCRCARLQSGW